MKIEVINQFFLDFYHQNTEPKPVAGLKILKTEDKELQAMA